MDHREYSGHREVERMVDADGRIVTIDYRADGKLDTISSPLGVATYGYHATTGKLTSITDPDGGTLAKTYDGSLPTSLTWGGPAGHLQGSVSFGYDANFWLDTTSVNGTTVVDYDYDDGGLVLGAGALSIARDVDTGDIIGTTAGTASTIEGTNTFGKLDNYIAQLSSVDVFSEQVTLRDARGRIVERVETVQGAATTYRYSDDAAGRLTDVEHDGVVVSHYDYDANGNRLGHVTALGTTAGSYDDRDRLDAYGGFQYFYNESGQLSEKLETATSASTSFDYDPFGNLRSVLLSDGRAVEYEIDANNRRIGKRIDGAVQWRLLYKDQLEPVAMLDAANNVVAAFVYSTRAHVPDLMVRGGQTYRFIVDHLGSVRLVVNVADGTVAQVLEYDEFGNVLADSNPGWQPFGFAGGLYDADTGLVRFGARDYDAVTGRWTAKDPILFAGGTTNLYEYANGDPVNRRDPSGLDTNEYCYQACVEDNLDIGDAVLRAFCSLNARHNDDTGVCESIGRLAEAGGCCGIGNEGCRPPNVLLDWYCTASCSYENAPARCGPYADQNMSCQPAAEQEACSWNNASCPDFPPPWMVPGVWPF